MEWEKEIRPNFTPRGRMAESRGWRAYLVAVLDWMETGDWFLASSVFYQSFEFHRGALCPYDNRNVSEIGSVRAISSLSYVAYNFSSLIAVYLLVS